MAKYLYLAPFFLAATLISVVTLHSADLGSGPWAISRASGLASFVVLSASVVLGLLISTKAGDGIVSRSFAFEMHQFLAITSLTLIAVHAGSLLFDGFLHLTVRDLAIPFTSPYRPVAVGLGVIAAWLAAFTTASFWMRLQIGQKRWRRLHLVTFVAYFAGLGHGLFAGTDTSVGAMYWMYVVSAAFVLALTTLRITGYRTAPKAAKSQRVALKALSQSTTPS